jgi:hypothetical protein
VVSADTREAECNCIARLEHWKVILDSLFRPVNQVIKQALVWTKQETPLSYEIENRILAGYLGNTEKLTELGRGDFT